MIAGKQNNQKKAYSSTSIWRNNKVRRGFSLIEVLVTLLVLTISITGVTFLMTKNIADVQNSKNQIIVSMLAQEGIELVRNLKDNDDLQKPNPPGTPLTRSNCRISEEMGNLADCNSSSDNKRLYLKNNSFYQHTVSGNTPTKFYRRVDVSTIRKAGTDETTVTVYVTWNNKGFVDELNDPKNDCTTANKCVSAISIIPDLF